MTSLALIGGQYGSEGKGVIAAALAPHFAAAVRTGGPNAGHSFFHERTLYKMRQVPCAWVNPSTGLMLGAGAVIDPSLLEAELARTGRIIFVDPQAAIITRKHHDKESEMGLRELIGSTTEGVGAARADKMKRNGAVTLARDWAFSNDRIIVEPVAPLLWDERQSGGMIMLEGTQGALLSLHHGRYPFVTSADTNAAQLAADAGLPPSDVEHTHLVVRTHPIRVAGNSGPTGGDETTWEDLQLRGVVDAPERTTVTNNVRRIFEFSPTDLQTTIMLNDPCGIWVTFGDYLSTDARDARDIDDLMDIPEVGDWVRKNISPTGRRILGIGVGGDYWRVVETGDACHRDRNHRARTWELHPTNAEATNVA